MIRLLKILLLTALVSVCASGPLAQATVALGSETAKNGFDDIVSGSVVKPSGHGTSMSPGEKASWVLKRDEVVEHFFGDGKIELTSGGNLKITIQRKGSDAGRDTAKMLQFKINPALLFDDK